eukprot:TRINITY_DN24288_c0_g1_i1.p1 TRINITY_DN24288_c0_g1~~TRINITY_DN24288_c0_g1_i1.p1  ORF type:complete len:513 (-),score=82.84 TRINITY_DN24288_c0_g1_i1:182-1501(-)
MFVTILGFMVTFRANQAWMRYWEGATIIQQTRGEWANAISSLFSFCTDDGDKANEVYVFKNQITRLTSLLYSIALTSLSGAHFDCIGQEDLSDEIDFLLDPQVDKEVRCEVIVQWIQKAVMKQVHNNVVTAPAPIVSRVFHELSRGMVNVSNAQKINEIKYPFQLAQILTMMLVAFTIGVTVASAYAMDTIYGCTLSSFANVLALWSVIYASTAIDRPYGTGLCCLPLENEMKKMNDTLKMLLLDGASQIPEFIGCGQNLVIKRRSECSRAASLKAEDDDDADCACRRQPVSAAVASPKSDDTQALSQVLPSSPPRTSPVPLSPAAASSNPGRSWSRAPTSIVQGITGILESPIFSMEGEASSTDPVLIPRKNHRRIDATSEATNRSQNSMQSNAAKGASTGQQGSNTAESRTRPQAVQESGGSDRATGADHAYGKTRL